MIYTTKVLEICENGDAIVELPDELVKELNWQIGDTIDYEMKNEAVYIKNLSKEKRDASAT
jgi:antitoxin component of MazEF toxin-antitoxin module